LITPNKIVVDKFVICMYFDNLLSFSWWFW